jgi:hypothetical protein
VQGELEKRFVRAFALRKRLRCGSERSPTVYAIRSGYDGTLPWLNNLPSNCHISQERSSRGLGHKDSQRRVLVGHNRPTLLMQHKQNYALFHLLGKQRLGCCDTANRQWWKSSWWRAMFGDFEPWKGWGTRSARAHATKADYRIGRRNARDGAMPAPNTKAVTSHLNSTRNNSTNISLIKAALAAIKARNTM